MLKVALGDLLRDPPGGKEGRRDAKIEYKEEGWSGLGEGSFQTYRTMSDASGCNHFGGMDEELERLCRLVRDLELEAKGRRRGKDHEDV